MLMQMIELNQMVVSIYFKQLLETIVFYLYFDILNNVYTSVTQLLIVSRTLHDATTYFPILNLSVLNVHRP